MGRNDIWVFMSHSSKDYEKVCKVRNELEKRGFRPLMFFLKCLDDKKNDKEVESLIFREIDSRARFILCDSDNAKASDWVKKEVEYIQGKNRFFFTINLDLTEDPDKLASAILHFTKRATVILSYSHKDKKLVSQLKDMLQSHDFIVYDLLEQLSAEDYLSSELSLSIKQIIDSGGYYIPLISNNFMRSEWCLAELKYALDALRKSGYRRVLPVQIERIPFWGQLSRILSKTDVYDVFSNSVSLEESLERKQMTPDERIITNILDLLYWSDMENETFLQNASTKEEAEQLFERGRKLYYADRDHERIDHAAVMFLRKASVLGHTEAMLLLANCYEYGTGVIMDKDKARFLREKAALVKGCGQKLD